MWVVAQIHISCMALEPPSLDLILKVLKVGGDPRHVVETNTHLSWKKVLLTQASNYSYTVFLQNQPANQDHTLK